MQVVDVHACLEVKSTAVLISEGRGYVLQVLLAGMLNQLEALLDTLLRDGFQPLQAAYLGAWLHTGQQVPSAVALSHHAIPSGGHG